MMRGWSGGAGVSECALGPSSWFSATSKKCFRGNELAGARGDPGVVVLSKMNQ